MSIWAYLFDLTWVVWTAVPVLWIGLLAYFVYKQD